MFTNGVFVNSKNHVVKLYICATHDIEAKTIAGIANGYISKRTVMLATLFFTSCFLFMKAFANSKNRIPVTRPIQRRNTRLPRIVYPKQINNRHEAMTVMLTHAICRSVLSSFFRFSAIMTVCPTTAKKKKKGTVKVTVEIGTRS